MNENNQEESKPVNSEAITHLLETFFSRFVPAKSNTDCMRKTTNEIIEMLSSHCPYFITPSTVYDAMIERNYQYDFIEEGSRIVWLLEFNKKA